MTISSTPAPSVPPLPLPVVVPATTGSIVVGHDGSAGASAALEVALGMARDLSAPLVIVRTWSIDTAPRGAVFHDGYAPSFAEVGETVRAGLREETAALTTRYPDVDAVVRTALGQPAEILIGMSVDARMLVVGSRGLGGFAGMVLGSVSDRCVRHARCPVLVVPRSRDRRA